MLRQAAVLERARQALAGTGYELVEGGELSPSDTLAENARKIKDQEPDVVVMDYWPEDAASVKLMQSVDERPPGPAFIFVQPAAEVALNEALLALNEGAEAFLTDDFSPPALVNYVERAVNGPGRLRWRSRARAEDDSGLEVSLGEARTKSARFQKLIAHLLSEPPAALQRKTLVVSDSPFQRDLLKKILQEHNFPTLIAPGFDEGLALAAEETPRIIVSDLELAGRTGLELCRAVKFEHKIIPCYFVICTASQGKIDQVMSPGNGVDDCLLKPAGSGDTADFISRVALGLLL